MHVGRLPRDTFGKPNPFHRQEQQIKKSNRFPHSTYLLPINKQWNRHKYTLRVEVLEIFEAIGSVSTVGTVFLRTSLRILRNVNR